MVRGPEWMSATVSAGFALPLADHQPDRDAGHAQAHPAGLRGELRKNGTIWPVHIEECPTSGLVVAMDTPPLGEAELWIENFGCVPVHVTYAGDRFAGLMVGNPAVHRDRLMLWLCRRWPVASSPMRGAPLFLAAAVRRQRAP
jgi:hypothetical protein